MGLIILLTGFLHPQCGQQCQNGHHQCQKWGDAQGNVLIELKAESHPGCQALHQVRIIDRCTQTHGDDKSDGLNAHLLFQYTGPVFDIAFSFE